MREKERPKTNSIGEILRGKTHVITETFLLRSSASDQDIQIIINELLSLQGLTDPDKITFWKSEAEKFKGIINTLKDKKSKRTGGDPRVYIVGFDRKELEGMFDKISTMAIEHDPILEGIDGKDIAILRLNAPETSMHTDPETGVTLATLKKGEPAYPMHPTPAN